MRVLSLLSYHIQVPLISFAWSEVSLCADYVGGAEYSTECATEVGQPITMVSLSKTSEPSTSLMRDAVLIRCIWPAMRHEVVRVITGLGTLHQL